MNYLFIDLQCQTLPSGIPQFILVGLCQYREPSTIGELNLWIVVVCIKAERGLAILEC